MESRPAFSSSSPSGDDDVAGLEVVSSRVGLKRDKSGTGRKLPCKRQGQIAIFDGDGMMHGDQLGAVGKSAFDLHFGNHRGHARHDLIAAEELAAEIHQLGDALAVADEFEQLRGDQARPLRDDSGASREPAAFGPESRPGEGAVCQFREEKGAWTNSVLTIFAPKGHRATNPGRNPRRLMNFAADLFDLLARHPEQRLRRGSGWRHENQARRARHGLRSAISPRRRAAVGQQRVPTIDHHANAIEAAQAMRGRPVGRGRGSRAGNPSEAFLPSTKISLRLCSRVKAQRSPRAARPEQNQSSSTNPAPGCR